jgi:protein SCO1/2
MKQKIKYLEKYLSILGLVCVVCIAMCYVFFTMPHNKKKHHHANDLIVSTPESVYDFTLNDNFGNIFDAQKLKGKPSLIYFGFSFCPDICPTALHTIAKVVDTSKKYGIDLNSVFITIDPARDTSEVLAKYVKYFSPSLIALTGSEEEIRQVAEIFNVYYAKASDTDDSNYMLNHSSFIYVIDKKGKIVKFFNFQDDPQEIIDFVRLNFRK